MYFFPHSLAVHSQDVVLEPNNTEFLLNLGDTLNLTCVYSMNFMDNDTLFFIFQLDGELVQNSTDDTLVISYLNQSSVSQGGSYFCSVDDGVMRIDASNSTMVLFSPIIVEHPVDIYTTTSNDVVFNCTAAGFPAPDIQWYRLMDNIDLSTVNNINDVPGLAQTLPTNALIRFYNTSDVSIIESSLIIQNVMFGDFGTYVCLASLREDSLVEDSSFVNISFAFSNFSTLTGEVFNIHVRSIIMLLYVHQMTCIIYSKFSCIYTVYSIPVHTKQIQLCVCNAKI